MREFEPNPYDTDQPIYQKVAEAIGHLRQADLPDSLREALKALDEVERMIRMGELQFSSRYRQLRRLKLKGMVEGVMIKDKSGIQGHVPKDGLLGWAAYPYHIVFENEEGKTVLMTNGIHDAEILP